MYMCNHKEKIKQFNYIVGPSHPFWMSITLFLISKPIFISLTLIAVETSGWHSVLLTRPLCCTFLCLHIHRGNLEILTWKWVYLSNFQPWSQLYPEFSFYVPGNFLFFEGQYILLGLGLGSCGRFCLHLLVGTPVPTQSWSVPLITCNGYASPFCCGHTIKWEWDVTPWFTIYS